MPLITLMSDYGDSDHYVAAVKAKILSDIPTAIIVDISHKIQAFNLPHAAYVLKAVWKDFPSGTIHLVAVNSPSRPKDKFLAMRLKDHYFIGMDNGLFSLISDDHPDEIVELPSEELSFTFPAKYVLAPAAVELANGKPLAALGSTLPSIRTMLNRQLRMTRNQIIGHVIHVDHYGNLITNISKKEFETISRGRPFTLSFSRESLDEISNSYYGTENGDCLALFNSSGTLEIAISQGNAAELLGMNYDSPVLINFIGE